MNVRSPSPRSLIVIAALSLGGVAAGCGSDSAPVTDSSFGVGPPAVSADVATTLGAVTTAGADDHRCACAGRRLADDRLADHRRSSAAAGAGRLALRDRRLRPAGAGDEPSGRLGGVRGRATGSGRGRDRPVERCRARHQRPHQCQAESRACSVSRSTRPPTSPTSTTRRRPGTRSSRSSPSIRQPACSIRRRVREVLTVEQPYSNHNGGQLAFGPDQLLYIGLGDGGSGGDPQRNALDLGSRLGKILRIDPVANGDQPFTVPADNPFVDTAGRRPDDLGVRIAQSVALLVRSRRPAICGSPTSARATGKR